MKGLFAILMAFVFLLVFIQGVNAQTFTFDTEVNGVDVAVGGDPIRVDRGDRVVVRVVVSASGVTDTVEDVTLEAKIRGYEHGTIDVESDIFDMTPDVRYTRVLVLNVPKDIDALDNYNLKVTVGNQDDEYSETYVLEIGRERHLLDFVDVFFNPGLVLDADQPLFVTVRLENMGDKKEEDIRVEASIPELGINVRDYLDELAGEAEKKADDEETSGQVTLPFLDLSNVEAGTYTLRVRAHFNRGHDFIEELFDLTVNGVAAEEAAEELMVDAEMSKQVMPGKGVAYKVSLANLAAEQRTFQLTTAGLETWATSRVDPSLVTVQAGGTAEAFVFVSANENAELGAKAFSLRVTEDNVVVKELQLEANVAQSADALSGVKTGLEIGFIVLLIILVILGLVIAITKMKGREEVEEPTPGEAQTYY